MEMHSIFYVHVLISSLKMKGSQFSMFSIFRVVNWKILSTTIAIEYNFKIQNFNISFNAPSS